MPTATEAKPLMPESNADPTSTEILVLQLDQGEHKDSTLYRLKAGACLHLSPGPSLLGKNIILYCNYPERGEKFERKKYNRLKWQWSNRVGNEGTSQDQYAVVRDTDMYCEIIPTLPGSYHYYFIYNDCTEPQGSGYFLLEPKIVVGPKDSQELIMADAIRCQTVLAKSLGDLESWERKLRVAHESCYNMIHFTPIQELGVSNSSYSLSDQMKLNPIFSNGKNNLTYGDIEAVVTNLSTEWKMASICDIVLNHTANESKWLLNHPECAYTCFNNPHLRPAYLVDIMLVECSRSVSKGEFTSQGVPKDLNTHEQLNALKHILHTVYVPQVKVWELFQLNLGKLEVEFCTLAKSKTLSVADSNIDADSLKIIQDKEYKRFGSTVNLELALQLYNISRPGCNDEDSRLEKCTEEFLRKLETLNNCMKEEIQGHLNVAIENAASGVCYERVDNSGLRLPLVDDQHPLFSRYFTEYGPANQTLKQQEELMYSPEGCFLMAHNGWVMNGDPLKDFARPQLGTGNVYLRRELIAWADSVKLRYGDNPEDCPFLWDHMKTYVNETARIFHGLRLDNAHSTPLLVAEYLLDSARQVNPNIYVVAELFTNSDLTDNIFVNRLGITSLIREGQSAWNSHELGRLVYRYGGDPVGAFRTAPASTTLIKKRVLTPSIAHALFLDLTHDNPSPIQVRSVFDLLPSSALVSMACCATGSNRGYDELVPHHIHVVNETRFYTSWDDEVNLSTGIIAAKKALNELHGELADKGFTEVYVDQMNPDIVAVTRHNPISHQSVILVAYTCFSHPSSNSLPTSSPDIKQLRFEGHLDQIVLEASLSHSTGTQYKSPSEHEQHAELIYGLTDYKVTVKQNIQLNESSMLNHALVQDGITSILNFSDFRPGSVLAIRVSLKNDVLLSVEKLHSFISNIYNNSNDKLNSIVESLDLNDLNQILYKCDQEEVEHSGIGTYNIPNYGPLVYCGLQGFVSLLSEVKANNDLGHPICANLRSGDWMIDYIWQRLKKQTGLEDLGSWLEINLKSLKEIPRYLIPSYFETIVTGLHALMTNRCYDLMSNFIKGGSSFSKDLALGSVQCTSICVSANLPRFSPNLKAPKPPPQCSTLSAGLPHFSTGYMRCWGRDTFISLRGLMLMTGRIQEARQHILGFGACLRHGLIPNLLDGGYKSRFNCRDAVWWWLHCIRSYTELVHDGKDILADKVSRLFPQDDSPAKEPGEADQPLCDTIHEALQTHFQGLVFRERNAGKAIDEHMTDAGFNNQIGTHLDTGFVYGGNEWNAGTWMDKMGSSDAAGTRGRPATPRDGSAVEIVGLSYSVLTWLVRMHSDGAYPYDSVKRQEDDVTTKWTLQQWADKIAASFENNFYIGGPGELVHRVEIYKDTLGATQPWCDYQLRCNFPIAMAVAPELFDKDHAWKALEQLRKLLLGPLGVKTLDPADWSYRPNYDNSNQSNDPKLAHGYNYHQGPEWVWPIGFYLRARLHFAQLKGCLKEEIAETRAVLSRHLTEMKTNHWRGLPELTNDNGSYCQDSSRTQAWSMATVLEVLFDLEQLDPHGTENGL